MMNSHKSLLLIFIFCLTWVFAGTDGTIRGRVTDEESSMELPGATIYLPELGIGVQHPVHRTNIYYQHALIL